MPSPNGSGGAPRQGWINAQDGNLYRLWFFTFAQGFNRGPKSDGYLGAYTIFTPLSRRLDLIINVPFVLRNNAVTGLPIIDPNRPGATTTQSHTGFGDMSFTPRVLLHETKDFSLTAELAVVTPTGTQPLAGNTTTLIPAVGFWNNFAGGWVLRGGLGLAIPMNGSGDNLISQLAIGQTLTGHDVPLFGDFTYYLSTVVNTPLANGDQTSVTLTPGMRTHVGNDWYFLAGLPTPVDQSASRRHRYDLLVHESVVSRRDQQEAKSPGRVAAVLDVAVSASRGCRRRGRGPVVWQSRICPGLCRKGFDNKEQSVLQDIQLFVVIASTA